MCVSILWIWNDRGISQIPKIGLIHVLIEDIDDIADITLKGNLGNIMALYKEQPWYKTMMPPYIERLWWHQGMETHSTQLTLCEGATREFHHEGSLWGALMFALFLAWTNSRIVAACFVQNCQTIGLLKRVLEANAISPDLSSRWVSEEYVKLHTAPVYTIFLIYMTFFNNTGVGGWVMGDINMSKRITTTSVGNCNT